MFTSFFLNSFHQFPLPLPILTQKKWFVMAYNILFSKILFYFVLIFIVCLYNYKLCMYHIYNNLLIFNTLLSTIYERPYFVLLSTIFSIESSQKDYQKQTFILMYILDSLLKLNLIILLLNSLIVCNNIKYKEFWGFCCSLSHTCVYIGNKDSKSFSFLSQNLVFRKTWLLQF